MKAESNARESPACERIGLIDSLEDEWLKIPLRAMREVGPAAQTLGGLLNVSNRETFASRAKIATNARLPARTVEKHLATLHNAGWIANQGRQETRSGRPRRTATRSVTKKTKANMEPYGILPWWAAGGRMPWCAKAVFSVLMARLCSLKKAAIEEGGQYDEDAAEDWILGYLDVDNRFRFSLARLERDTGLSRRSINKAKRVLAEFGIIELLNEGDGHLLVPNFEFRVVETPVSTPGYVHLEFDRGCKNGR